MPYLGPVGKESYNTRSQWTEIETERGPEYRYRDVGSKIKLESRPGDSFPWLDAGEFEDKDAMYAEIKNEMEREQGE